ncbi:MAG: hypothetical protein HFI98_06750 [Lachnospiraceae bacterium]|nr:hypothetical protein [Lachnospiraceae bacterium]
MPKIVVFGVYYNIQSAPGRPGELPVSMPLDLWSMVTLMRRHAAENLPV